MGLARPARARASGRINASCACLPGKTRGCFAAAFFFMTPSCVAFTCTVFVACVRSRAVFTGALFSCKVFRNPAVCWHSWNQCWQLSIGSGFTAFALRSLRGGRPIFLACLRGRKVFIKQSRLDEQAGSLAFTPGFFCRRAGGRRQESIKN